MEKVGRENRGGEKGKRRACENNQKRVETIVPAIQAEQVEDDVAPATAEYVPAKARDEEYGYGDSKTSV